MRRIKIAPPAIDVILVNGTDHQPESSPASTANTFRLEGLSIGKDYMRFEGATLSTSLSPSALNIEAILGEGACSVVKRARHITTHEPYALKIFPVRNDAMRKTMLEKELRALCCLDCDCLVGLVGSFYDRQAGEITMILEYMDRGSLLDVMDYHATSAFSSSLNRRVPSSPRGGCALPEAAVASIAYQMLWGVGYLHYENIIHRDVKPANVLVNSGGEVKLSDFGIISRRGEDGGMNCTVVGTTRYMSPERLRARAYGCSSDIWSMGLVILECALGRSPFENCASMVELVLTVEETPIDQLVPLHLHPLLRELLCGCLHQEPGKLNIHLLSVPFFFNISDFARKHYLLH
jgi:serine/threonine protein kinase